jgi:hypothetical protein
MGALAAFLADGFFRFIFPRPRRAGRQSRLEQFSINDYRLRGCHGGERENRKRLARNNDSAEKGAL